MSHHSLIQKTDDVSYSPNILTALGMDTLVAVRSYNILEYMTCDIDLLTRRSLIFRDTIQIKGLDMLLKDTIDRLLAINEILKLQARVSETDRGLYVLRRLQHYFDIIDALSDFYQVNAERFASPEYAALFSEAADIAATAEYARLKENTNPVIAEIERVKSITVGFNIDAALSPYEAGLLSINDTCVESGSIIDRILRLDTRAEEDALRSIVPLVPARSACTADEYEALTYATYSALNKVFKKQVRKIEPEVNRYIKEHLDYLLSLLPDLRFIYDLSDIQKRLLRARLSLCVPTFCAKEEKAFDAQGLYNPILALHKYETSDPHGIIPSDFSFDEAGGIYLLTGPNSGGKTVFLKSVGIAQIMAQIGMMVPAERMTVSPVSRLFVEFPTHTTDRKAGGRLEYECAEIRDIFEKIDPHSLVLLDEAFSSTAPDEAVALALEVLKAMSQLGVRGIYISHYHLLTKYLQELNAEHFGKSRFDFLAADMAGKEDRTYRITRREPDGSSYSGSIAERYGISAARLMDVATRRA